MKISKNSKLNECDKIKDDKITSTEEVFDDQDLVDELGIVPECRYPEACGFIMQAIDALSAVAETDQTAKDAIANLSVVYFDLK